jgi:cellulose synthase/poly-beta-1,6-N-acetylglucosamine synthase-like glycosyltransferase
MIFLQYLVTGYFIVLIVVLIILIFLLLNDRSENVNLPAHIPFVSVFVAFRNEEENIYECLESLSGLKWPADKLEILLGDDSSDDRSVEIITSFIGGKQNFRLIHIGGKPELARGKANVLAHLAHEARGDFFFFTDADIRLPDTWIQGLLSGFTAETGIISGATIAKPGDLFSSYQTIDWVNSVGMIRAMSNLRVPVTAVGNNMVITREAYFATGGYEKIPFSVTEDFELFRQTLLKGRSFKNLLQPEVIAISEPLNNFRTFLNQRRRWMKGAMQLPFYLILILSLQAGSLPFILVSFFLFPAGIYLWILRIITGLLFTWVILRMAGKQGYWKFAFLYEIISPVLNFIQLISYWMPGKVVWKGRKY